MDHGGEVFGFGVAVAASVDQADLGVDAFEAAVGEAVLDSGDDAVEVLADLAGKVDERLEPGPFRRSAPGSEVAARRGRVNVSVERAQALL
ncbi:MAG TPA: hypothetical protein VGR26_00365 [Acidimicrobiales bacterium]|nr:hypothetical protein [Acidimicrobiales bacterium]